MLAFASQVQQLSKFASVSGDACGQDTLQQRSGRPAPDNRSVHIAREWLSRQKANNGEACLDEGDCRICGFPSGEGHEKTDPCGIISGLLTYLEQVGGAGPAD